MINHWKSICLLFVSCVLWVIFSPMSEIAHVHAVCQAEARQKPLYLTQTLALLAGDVINFKAVRGGLWIIPLSQDRGIFIFCSYQFLN